MANMTLQVGRRVFRRQTVRRWMALAVYALTGFVLAALGVLGHFQPLALGFLCAGPGGLAGMSAALGGAVGYLTLWGAGGAQGAGWMVMGLGLVLVLADRGLTRRQWMLMPAVAALVVSGWGLWFQQRLGDRTAVPVYLLRVALGVGSTMLFQYLLAVRPMPAFRRGETVLVQVRLEQTALVLRQVEKILLPQPRSPDRGAILLRAVDSACDACPERRACRARGAARELNPGTLEQPGLGVEDLPPGCRKPARLLGELRRGQEQLRRVKGERNHAASCRDAVRQQYGFLAEYLQNQSDFLAQRRTYRPPRFQPEVGSSSRSLQLDNGDQCAWFEGAGNRFYVVLCDGMGTGTAAMAESRETVQMLRQLLGGGFPAEYALRSLNNLWILREMGGCATVDLVELELDSGRATLYKWGAAPSYLSVGGQLKKIGTAGPPPGLSQQARETGYRLSLGGGEVLILLSDGAGEEGLLQSKWTSPMLSPGEMAAAIVEGSGSAGDDATAVVIRLSRPGSSTQ